MYGFLKLQEEALVDVYSDECQVKRTLSAFFF